MRESLRGPRLRLEAPNLARLVPVVLPGPERPGMVALTRALLRAKVERAVRSLGASVAAVVSTSAIVGGVGRWPGARRVYWAQDDHVGGAQLMGLDASRIARGEEREVRRSDLVVAANPVVEARWQRAGAQTVLIPYGCDADRFATVDEVAVPDDVDLPAPVAGFVGHLGDRIDFDLLDAVADRGISLLLVGPRHERSDHSRLDQLVRRDTVRWVGPRAFEELPAYLRAIDVGLVPYADSAFNRGSFPLKTLEYLAAGRPVVATPLPAIEWLDTDLVALEAAPSAFAEAVVRSAGTGRDDGLVERRRRFAAAHSWATRAAAFADALGVREDGGGPARAVGVATQRRLTSTLSGGEGGPRRPSEDGPDR